VQGQLRKEYISIQVETKCSHCGHSIHFSIDSNMQVSIRDQPQIHWCLCQMWIGIILLNKPSLILTEEIPFSSGQKKTQENIEQVKGK
jgi:hypothetical protein